MKKFSSNRKLFDDKELEAIYEETKEFFRKLKVRRMLLEDFRRNHILYKINF